MLNNLNLSTSYNLAGEEFQLSPIRISTGVNLFDNLVSINLNATLDPYGIDEENRRINTFHIKNGGGLARMTSANINTNFTLDNDTFKKGFEEEEEEEEQEDEEIDFNEFERLSGGGRDDDLFPEDPTTFPTVFPERKKK